MCIFFFSSRRRHTRCALVTGVQTCALPIYADTIAQKIRKSKTDPEPLPSEAAGLEGRPEARNLVGIYAALSGESVEQVLARFGGQGFGAFKPALARKSVV